MRIIVTASAVALVGLASLPTSAMAQRFCPEGRTASGQCVNARLAQAQRAQAIVQTQQKLSCVSAPVLPLQDRDYWVTRHNPGIHDLFVIGSRFVFLFPQGC